MVVTVTMGPQSTVVLDEPDDCKRFHVAVHGGRDRSRLAVAITEADAGDLDGDDVLVRVAWLRTAAAGRVSDDWDAAFTAMLDYARGKGWLDATGQLVRAHVEWMATQ